MFKLQRLEITGFKSFADYTEVVFTGNGITAVVGPNGCGKCVSGDTLITLANGAEIEIRQLVENALQKAFFKEQFDDGLLTRDNPNNIEILSLNPVTLKLERRKISAFIKRETTEKLLRVKTRAGREIKATPYHPLFTLENGKLVALRADELKVGVKIAIPRILPTQERTIELSATEYFQKFDVNDRIFLPFTEALSNWKDDGKKQFGSLSNWAVQAGVSTQCLNNLRSKQSVNIAEINKLSAVSKIPFSSINQIKSHQNGFLKLPRMFSPKLAKFLGLLIAEGRNTYSSQVWFVNSDAQVNQQFANLAKELFDIATVQKDYKKGATDSLIFSQSLCKTLEKVFNFRINSNSFEKEIPPQIFQTDSATKWAFLSGLFEGDAYICSRPQKNNGKILNYIEYATASEKLAKQVISLLLQLGIFAYLRPKQKYASNTLEKRVKNYYSVLIYGSKKLKTIAENLEFVGEKQKSLEKLRNIEIADNPNRDLIPTGTDLVREAVKLAKVKIKPNRKEFPKIAAYTGKICEASRNGLNEVIKQIKYLSEDTKPAEHILENIEALANSDVYWDEIVSIEEIEPTDNWVYDLSINETHNFVAGNMIVHNSNVSESIAWVLGEQRAKALRGSEMKDVVFQGTSKRKPSGMAEVVLHLVRDESPFYEDELGDIDLALGEIDDHAVSAEEFETALEEPSQTEGEIIPEHAENSTGTALALTKVKTKRHWRKSRIALDFAPGESVSVTRRLYLSGESEYLLNGKTCRLRDIQDLFSGTGLSGAHYAIIEQGRIGQILSAKPSDRRSLIEEAAGISKFRTRQRAAEARLESAKTNLRRISDIVEEIDKQANSLRRQASKTRRYKVLREELRELLKQVFAAEGSFLTELVTGLENKLEEAVTLERALFAEVTAKDEAFREATHRAREAEESLAQLRSNQAENALQRDRNSRELVYKQEQINNLRNRLAILEGEIKTLKQRLEMIKAEADRLKKEEKIQREEAEKEELILRETEKKYQSKLNELRQIETEIEVHRSELLTHTAAVERFAEIERQLENNAERLNERSEGLKREGERAEENYAEHLKENQALEKSIAEIRQKLSKLQTEKRELMESANEAKLNLQSAEKDLRKLTDEFSRTKHRLETLKELDEKRAVYAPNVQKIFSEQNKIGVKLVGTLADKFTVEETVEKAVENLFGTFLQTILVETEEEARKIAKYVSENNVGRISVLVVSPSSLANSKKQRTKDKEQRTGIKELLGVDNDFASLLEEIFPREMSAQVVENIDVAKVESFVTKDGDLVFANKLFVSGKANSNEKNSSLLGFKRELRELQEKSEKFAQEIGKSEKEIAKLRAVLSKKETQISELQTVVTTAERELLSQEIQAKSLTQEIDRAERHKKVVAEETKQIENELIEIATKQNDAKANAKKAELARKTASEKLTEVSEKLGAARQKIEAESQILNERRTLAATSAERRRSAQAALRRVEAEQSEIESRLSRQNFEIAENENNLTALNSSIDQIKNKISGSEEEQNKEQSELNAATENLRLEREKADGLSEELALLNQRSAEARNSRAEIEVKKAESITRLQNLNENCSHDLNQSLVELVEEIEVAEDFDLEDSRREAENLRQKLEGFGAVNMLALEELSETEERLLFLTSQRQDIIDSINSAEEALREIKQRSRERFRDAFEAVNGYFKEFFLELFGGGKGEMVLLEADDILESGIEIVAQPPGKRLQNILLLSGGEKAMTAIALVMAIFQYRPSPFCLLDEVDAPLDDANVGRFVDKIAQMSEKTQFIVITHNKRTMESAKALYGVTMEEAGVSKVVSVKFE